MYLNPRVLGQLVTLLHSHKTPLLEKTTMVKIGLLSLVKTLKVKIRKRFAENDKMQEHSILRLLFLFYIGTSARSGSHNKLAKVHSMID